MTVAELTKQVADLTNRVARLEKKQSSSGQPDTGTFGFDKLSEAWADRQVRKDPPFWIKDGKPSYVGKLYSECPVDYLVCLAGFIQYKADKSAADPSPKLKNDGTPWYKQEQFDAKLVRTWVAFKQSGQTLTPQTAQSSAPVPFDAGQSGDDTAW
jgi:hypothetical protein